MKPGGALKYVVLAGVVVLCVLVVVGGLRRNARRLSSDPKIDLVKNFYRSRFDEKYVDPLLLASPEGKARLRQWSDRLKEEYAGIYVPKYGLPEVSQDPLNQRNVGTEDIAIKEMLPGLVEPAGPNTYAVASSLSIASEPIRFPTTYFYATVTVIERGAKVYVVDFHVDRFSAWAPGSRPAKDEQVKSNSRTP